MAPSTAPTWEDFERGSSSPHRSGSLSSVGGRSVQFREDDSLLRAANAGGSSGGPDDSDADVDPYPPAGEWSSGDLRRRRRRSSVTNRLAALGDIGGVNSVRSFARSWQRAAGFPEVIPQRPSFVFAPDQAPLDPGLLGEDHHHHERHDVEAGALGPRQSLLRQHLEAGAANWEQAVRDESPDPGAGAGAGGEEAGKGGGVGVGDAHLARAFRAGSSGASSGGYDRRSSSIFAVPPHLATPPLVGSYGSYRGSIGYGSYRGSIGGGGGGYGTIDSLGAAAADMESTMAQAGALWRQQQESGVNVPDGQVEPILVKEVEQDGKIVLTVEGQSTLPQTIFNSVNVLIGVGLLSLPMGIKYAGWICGMIIMAGAALVTAYTAGLLAKCMDLDPIVITFSDLAYISFGPRARVATSVLFTLELLAACVALIVLFADSLELLFPGFLSVTGWKILCSLAMMPLQFLPLRLLSFTSIVGILCCFGIVTILVIDGFVKQEAPGSLIEPAVTYLFPANWLTLPLSFGLLMSPWGGHSVFPNIYRDMRHPHRYGQAVKVTFSCTYLLDAVTAVAGVLMFGDDTLDEITSNVLKTSGYPRALTYLLCALIAVIPLTKIPLNARPIVTTAEVLAGLHQRQQPAASEGWLVGRSAYFRGAAKVAIRVAAVLVFLAISILFPAFDSIMAFMGSALCFTICVTDQLTDNLPLALCPEDSLPIAFYLKLFKDEISPRERLGALALMSISVVLSVVGTVWAFLPKSLIGAN
ncbi:uncharacterized protein E0L32_008192 [Thyridium curvatum]|uniref:Amino acid transporter transmembrane domain-containing protein n=1 Tax=Thyridium curvatum TaxID=1093900 RepID=A0A507ASU1_9PEZI|nr:uncharacterized protein E0L32_008192 [Thyridium curvatum]TPX10803.1 hypothetical protein E0L32_008192 [Thyridium curvatum]